MNPAEPGADATKEPHILQGTWWFPARRFLPGWGLPVRWQGWVVLAVYFALILGPAPFMHGRSPLYFLLYAFCLTMALGLVVAKKGEPLH